MPKSEEVKQKCKRNLDEISKKHRQQHDTEVSENVQLATTKEEVIEVSHLLEARVRLAS